MRLEFLLQFIVPFTFLAIWALTSLLNRDAQPLPPRPGTGRGPGGGPGRGQIGGGPAMPARVEPARPATASPERAAPPRWSTAAPPARPGAISSRSGDDGILIIDSETRGTQGSSTFSPAPTSIARASRAAGSSTRRTSARARSAAAPVKPSEPERTRALTGLVGQPLTASRRGKVLEITPLATPMTPIASVPLSVASQAGPPEIVRPVGPQDVPSLSIDALGEMLASPKRLREVALLGELLQPPVSLRGRRPRP